MYSIDKECFGAFVAALRKEKGLTQKELAEKLFISDKAVSKWETGASLPDTALLVPLSELLGVSVAELLRCKRIKEDAAISALEMDSIVQSAISYPKESGLPALCGRKIWQTIYSLSAVVAMAGTALYFISGNHSATPLLVLIFGLFYGAYFCFFARETLTRYYDENRIGGVYDGLFRMNMPGLAFNNSNWPYILLVGRLWSCSIMMFFPAFSTCTAVFLPMVWQKAELAAFLIFILGGLLVPIYVVGKKYE